jgi:hypothetical protein
MFSLSSSGSFKNANAFLQAMQRQNVKAELERYGKMGVDALSEATPRESGKTANSWTYEIFQTRGKYGISWYNTNVNQGSNIAILLQYGHGTGTGGYVQGYDYINPAIRPVFDRIADEVWKKVTNG